MGSPLRLVFTIASLLASLWIGENLARADDTDALYQARTIVTGQEEPSRSHGFAECLRQVLVKVSGDPRLADEPAVAALAGRAADYVESFRYHDRMSGIPVHDEQGTRERPHDLFVSFNPGKIDAALRTLGREPWIERPRVLMLVEVDNSAQNFILESDGQRGRDMREALAASADRFGVPVALPTPDALRDAGLTRQSLPIADPGQLAAFAKTQRGELPLVGGIDWNPENLGWSAAWSLQVDDKTETWRVDGVSFDAAFRSAVGGAAQILSGNGPPR